MITKSTTLILGAGASKDFGFPLGHELLVEVCELLTRGGYKDRLIQLQHQARTIEAFRHDLSQSGSPSVDAFLEHRTEFIDLGKVAIAIAMLPHERESIFPLPAPLFAPQNNHWYKYLLNKLQTNFKDIENNKLSIVTFNYDRSLEHYLFESLKSRYGKNDEECAEKINKIRIVHVYGQLGLLPWQKDYCAMQGVTIPYGYEPNLEELQDCARSINIVHEDTENMATNSSLQEASQLINGAERVYFLGFGYYSTNVYRLQIEAAVKNRNNLMRGTCLGYTKKEVVETTGRLFSGKGIVLTEPHLECLKWLRTVASLD